MSKQIWDMGSAEPEGVTNVVEVDGDGNAMFSDSMGRMSNTWARTNNGTGWKGYKDGKEYLDWPELMRYYGPVMEWTP